MKKRANGIMLIWVPEMSVAMNWIPTHWNPLTGDVYSGRWERISLDQVVWC